MRGARRGAGDRGERRGTRRAIVCASFVALLLLANSAGGLDPGTALAQYGHTAWRVREGYFAGPPGSIAQTRDGFLWIGTTAGLIRFDGVRFVRWEPPAGMHLPDDRIINLLGAGDGSLWIGTANGLARWHDGNLAVYARAGRFGALLEDRQGTLWAGHTRVMPEVPPLCRFQRGEFRCFRFADEYQLPYVGALYEDRQGNLWIGGQAGVCRWQPESPVCFEISELATLGDKSMVGSLAEDADGSLWVSTGPGPTGVWRLAAGRWARYPNPPAPPIDSGMMFTDRKGGLWIGTNSDGLIRRTHGRAERFSRVDGLSGDSVNYLFEDREGNVWVATSSGLDRFRDVKVATLTSREGLLGGHIGAVTAARDGSVWIAERRALIHLGKAGMSFYDASRGLPGSSTTSLLEDSRGRLWVGVDNGLAWRDRGRFFELRMPDGSAVGVVRSMAEDGEGNLWVVTTHPSRPLVRVRDQRVAEVLSAEQLEGQQISAIAADAEGGVWIGFVNSELKLYRHGRFESHGSFGDPRRRIHSLLADDPGLWAVTNRGLGLLRNGRLSTLGARHGLPCDDLEAAIRSEDGSLWLKAACGLIRIPPGELDSWTEHPDRRVRVRVLDAFDGAQAALSPFSPRAAKSVDGRLWFAIEAGGLQVLDPKRVKDNAVPPPVQILRLVADRKTYEPKARLRLPPRTRDLEIDYTALSFTVPEKVRFRYRLEGTHGDWQEVGARREASFTNLKPGSYRFSVVACNNDGVWNEKGATLDFAVLPAFYQTRAFLLLCVVASVFLAWASYRWHLRQVAARLDQQFQERLAERTRIAQDLHDTLLQGFLSASMQLHVAVDELPADAPEKPRFSRVLQLMREVIEEGRNAVRGLRMPAPQSSGTDDLAQALSRVPQELGLKEAAGFRVIVEGPPRPLRPLIRDEVYSIGREAVVNAFRHSGASEIEVEIEFAARALRLLVRDDGRGIDPEVLRSGREGHWGLSGMRERAERMGVRLKVWSRAGAGTEIELAAPAEIAFQGEPAAGPLKWLHRLVPKRAK
jgi:signal transduction histidine kinase/ligand-binding sensor domain-containing protein